MDKVRKEDDLAVSQLLSGLSASDGRRGSSSSSFCKEVPDGEFADFDGLATYGGLPSMAYRGSRQLRATLAVALERHHRNIQVYNSAEPPGALCVPWFVCLALYSVCICCFFRAHVFDYFVNLVNVI
jgi:hypothetical protein